ncbi:hypothetical protein NC661_13030 [Aquibacillus koreensis]|uniref:Uncharacterized protein n=1 Tax=Aquibacillus koreensis TaxID=279446 RepID=A0A9X3WQ30_9BACI|nr:hypothetical protein [Aquibacillus koreensis]MCT2536355.1 hypothetical protein [Aquibacillus koreensis]MDC3421294.1 hypothetical protein [Aquibacillus koreensis]
MREVIQLLADLVNAFHDLLITLSDQLGLQLSDKSLHFWIMGIIGIITYIIVYGLFKLLEKLKWSTALFSFIYTLTIMIVIVFAIEIQQAITNRGNMEFADAVIGLWGFIAFFFAYLIIIIIVALIKKRQRNRKHSFFIR